MAQWLRMLLAGGDDRPAGQRLLSAKVIAELFAPQTMVGEDAFYPTTRLTKPHWTTYGLGWFQAGLRRREGRLPHRQHRRDGRHRRAHPRPRSGRLRARQPRSRRAAARADVHGVRPLPRAGRRATGAPSCAALYDGLAKPRRRAARRRPRPSASPARRPTLAARPLRGHLHRPAATARWTCRSTARGPARCATAPASSGPLEHWHYDTFRAVWDARWRGTSQATFQIDAAGRVASVTTNGATFARVER